MPQHLKPWVCLFKSLCLHLRQCLVLSSNTSHLKPKNVDVYKADTKPDKFCSTPI